MSDDLSAASVQRWRRGRFGEPVRAFESIGSTNDEALRWATVEGAPEGAVVVTDHQTAGRGRHSRTWFSEPGAALQFSLILRPRLPLNTMGLLTTALGLACAEGIQIAAQLDCSLKWPNDVTIGGRKVAGILVESRVTGATMDVAIAGIGINVRTPTAGLPSDIVPRATTIEDVVRERHLESVPERGELLGWVLDAFERLYPRVGNGEGAAEIVERATKSSEVIGNRVIVRAANGSSFEGVATRLLPSGALEVEVNGEHRAVQAGEIEQLRHA